MTATAVIVDDHDEFRESATELLTKAGWDVVATARDAESAVSAVREHHPDLVLLDIGLTPGGADGIDVAHTLAEFSPRPDVVLVSARSALTYGARLTAAPARGFLSKIELTSSTLGALFPHE